MDCIRIYQKLNELKENPDSYPILWTPLHIATFNLKEMTVAMNDQVFKLVRGKSYQRPRGHLSHKADASNCDIRGKWPKHAGEYARIWGKTEKGDECALPSMAEVVMGIYLHHMVEMNERFQSLMEDDPLNRLGLYKVNM